MKYFNKFILYGLTNQELYKKLTLQNLYNCKKYISNNIISEEIFLDKDFLELFNYIKDNNKKYIFFNSLELSEYFPIKSKIYKTLKNKFKQNFKQLYIIKTNGTLEDIKNILNYICIKNNNEEFNIQDIYLIHETIIKSDAIFITLDINDFSLLFLKYNFTLTDLKHEFIHYLEWLGGAYIKKLNNNLDFNDIELFKSIFNIDDNIINYIFNPKEFLTLLTESYKLIEKIKLEYNISFDNIIKDIFKDKNVDIKIYLNKIIKLKYFQKYKTNYSFIFLIAHNCIYYKINTIKNHIFGYFIKNKE